jgi:hypothetical protein
LVHRAADPAAANKDRVVIIILLLFSMKTVS